VAKHLSSFFSRVDSLAKFKPVFKVEDRIPQATMTALRAKGYEIIVVNDDDGRVNGVPIDPLRASVWEELIPAKWGTHWGGELQVEPVTGPRTTSAYGRMTSNSSVIALKEGLPTIHTKRLRTQFRCQGVLMPT